MYWSEEMHKFLRQYRSTPYPSTCRLSEIPSKADTKSAVTTQVKLDDQSAKAKAKQYADHRNKAKEIRDFKIGDGVLVNSEKMGNKFTTPYQPESHTIQAKQGSMLTAASKDGVATRNSSFFKKILNPTDYKLKQYKPTVGRS